MNVKRAHRPSIIGKHGAVASNHPVATQAGLDVLRAGGSAVDAAIAVAFALGVAEPHMSGLGGDGFYHVYHAATGEGQVFNGSGIAPAGSVAAALASGVLDLDGPKSVSVPGSVGALGEMHARAGTLPWADLLKPAITAAKDGFGVTHVYQRFASRTLERVRRNPTSTETYLQNGNTPALGHFIKQAALAVTLETLAQNGWDDFYRGQLAKRLCADMAAAGISIQASDLAAYQPEVQRSVAVNYRGFEIRQTPPNSTGFVLLEALKIVECFDIKSMPFLSAELAHILIEAKKLAFVDRERFAGDPRHVDVPLSMLLSDDYAKTQAAQIDLDRAAVRPVRPTAGDGNTTYFCVVDGKGNAVSAIQSLNNLFGSGVSLPSTGVLMNNRLNCFHLNASHPNQLVDHKRVRHTMNAPMILKDGKPWAVFGTPGADDQVQVNLQVSVGLIDFEQDPQSVVESPRWSSSQQGQDANFPHGGSNTLSIESNFEAADIAALVARGHTVREVAPLEGTGSVACIRILENGALVAASDPRRDGWAGAF